MSDIVERLRDQIPPGRAWCMEAADEIERLRTELDKATRLVGQSIQWQRDAEIKLLKLRAATIEECIQIAAGHSATDWTAEGMRREIVERLRALKEQKMSELNLLLEPGATSPPAHQPDYLAALDAAFSAELTLRYHDYVESIPAIGPEASYDHFLQRWDAMAEAYNTLLQMIQSGSQERLGGGKP